MEKDQPMNTAPPAYDQANFYTQQGVYGDQAGIPAKPGPEAVGQQPPAYYTPGQYPQQSGYAPMGQAYPPGQTTVLVHGGPMANAPPDHMAYSIFVTICCCWPIGIFAILKASATKEAIARGDVQGAERLSGETRRLAHIALGVGIAILILSMVVVGVYVGLIVSGSLFG